MKNNLMFIDNTKYRGAGGGNWLNQHILSCQTESVKKIVKALEVKSEVYVLKSARSQA